MDAPVKTVTLNVYRLATSNNNNNSNGAASVLSSWLPRVGMGAYHTSLSLDGQTHYTFVANRGIVTSRSRQDVHEQQATFQEEIVLGTTTLCRGTIHQILQKLHTIFHDRSYHLLHRNCNHFTQVFATSLVLYDDYTMQEKRPKLNTYPSWINRLATTTGAMIGHDDDIVPCKDVTQEVAQVVGVQDKVGWNFTNSDNKQSEKPSQPKKKQGNNNNKSRQTKKELTPAQKAALAKIRKK